MFLSQVNETTLLNNMHSQHDIKILSNLTTRNKKTNPCNSIHEQQQETLQQTRTKHNTLPLSSLTESYHRTLRHIVKRTFLFPSTTYTSSPHLIQLHHLPSIHTRIHARDKNTPETFEKEERKIRFSTRIE